MNLIGFVVCKLGCSSLLTTTTTTKEIKFLYPNLAFQTLTKVFLDAAKTPYKVLCKGCFAI